MHMTNEEYNEYIRKKQPRSPLGMDMLRAFLVGGLICAGGEGLRTLYISFGLDAESAGTAVSISLVFLGALFTGLGLYDDIARFAGAGTPVPITGLANSDELDVVIAGEGFGKTVSPGDVAGDGALRCRGKRHKECGKKSKDSVHKFLLIYKYRCIILLFVPFESRMPQAFPAE